jgi:hypothetical protein
VTNGELKFAATSPGAGAAGDEWRSEVRRYITLGNNYEHKRPDQRRTQESEAGGAKEAAPETQVHRRTRLAQAQDEEEGAGSAQAVAISDCELRIADCLLNFSVPSRSTG